MQGLSYPFTIIQVPIGNVNYKIACIENPESLFDEFFKKESGDADVLDEKIPYWGDLWPSSIALSEFISENKNLVKGKHVLEIGCGLGLPGIVAAKNGAEVMLTDYLPDALAFAVYNWRLNVNENAITQLLDWRKPGNIPPADVLLASDVAYESRSFKPLLAALKKLVKKDGIILISEPNRQFAKTFFDDLKQMNFSVNEIKKDVIKDGIEYCISVYKLMAN